MEIHRLDSGNALYKQINKLEEIKANIKTFNDWQFDSSHINIEGPGFRINIPNEVKQEIVGLITQYYENKLNKIRKEFENV